jgi:GT2 family glycosyltransferase
VSDSSVTVAVAAYGRTEALERCLDALAAQTEPPGELIVVDQAPSVAARAAVDRFDTAEARYLEQQPLGLSASRNLALASTRTAHLAVTDDDCAPDPGWLATVAAALARPPRPDVVTGPILPVGEEPPGGFSISLRESGVAADHRGRMSPWGVGSGANFAAPVEVLRRNGGWDERLGAGSGGMAAEDADLLYRLLIAGATVRYEPGAIVRHEWQTRERRLATRWSYGHGIGAMCGLRLAAGDLYALRMLGGYARLHVRPLLGALRTRDRSLIAEHGRALASVAPGLLYGIGRRA